MGDGILLKPGKPFPEATLKDVAGCLEYQGTPQSLEDMENLIREGIDEKFVRRSAGLTKCIVKKL